MPGRGQYWKVGGLNDGVVRVEDLHPTSQTQHLLSFMLAELSSTQIGPSTGTTIAFDTVNSVRGTNITLNVGNNRFTLKAGKTYKLMAGIRADLITGVIDTQWRDFTNSSFIGKEASAQTSTDVSAFSTQSVAIGIITPSTDIEVILQVTGTNAGLSNVGLDHSYAMIEEI